MSREASSLARLAEVLRRAGVSTELRGPGGFSVSGACQDSRLPQEGALFLAWKGTTHDAHDSVSQAVENGAVAALVERWVEVRIPQLRVDDGRRAAAIAAHFLAGQPTRRLRMVGITGTNGKTTTAILARELLSRTGPTAALGTLGVVEPDGRLRPGSEGLTTPGPVQIAEALAALADAGVRNVCLEASSHALDQRRLDGLGLDVAAFTNLSRDHLDYHHTFGAYLEAKARLLLLLREGAGVVVNGRDPAWERLPPVDARMLVTRLEDAETPGIPACTGERLPDLVAEGVELSGEESRFRVRWGGEGASVSLPLLGRFNVENALSAIGSAVLLGVSLEDAAETLSTASPPAGRLEITVREPVPVILDYAHTPDALERVLETLRPLYPGRLILVFGAGGDRDREKRPQMGRVAARGADLVIVSSDNPRTEDPDAIVDDIAAGMEGATFERITDRRSAIARALELARPGDAVVLTGKGHETYQVVGTERRPFDEREIVRELLGSGGGA